MIILGKAEDEKPKKPDPVKPTPDPTPDPSPSDNNDKKDCKDKDCNTNNNKDDGDTKDDKNGGKSDSGGSQTKTLTTEELCDSKRPDYDCKKCPTVKVNWDGDCVTTMKPWYDDKLFTISDFDFTIGDAILSTVILIVLGAIGFAISSYIAWRKRKAIAAGARRMSASIKRASMRLRDSVIGKTNKVAQGDEESSDDRDQFGQNVKLTKDGIMANKD